MEKAVYLLTFTCMFFFTSCSPKLMPAEPSIKVVTEYRDRELHDTTVIYKDRVTEKIGDTIYITKTEYVYKLISKTDTCIVEKTDTIRTSVLVPYQPTRWEEIKIEIGGLAIGILIAIIFAFFMRCVYK